MDDYTYSVPVVPYAVPFKYNLVREAVEKSKGARYWTSVSHRLPELGEKVIVKYILSGLFSSGSRTDLGPWIKADSLRKAKYKDPATGKKKERWFFEVEATGVYEVVSWIYEPEE